MDNKNNELMLFVHDISNFAREQIGFRFNFDIFDMERINPVTVNSKDLVEEIKTKNTSERSNMSRRTNDNRRRRKGDDTSDEEDKPVEKNKDIASSRFMLKEALPEKICMEIATLILHKITQKISIPNETQKNNLKDLSDVLSKTPYNISQQILSIAEKYS